MQEDEAEQQRVTLVPEPSDPPTERGSAAESDPGPRDVRPPRAERGSAAESDPGPRDIRPPH